MKSIIFILCIIFLSIPLLSSQKKKSGSVTSAIQGVVYSIGAPAVRVDWTPPPFEQVSTIVVLDKKHMPVKEVTTDKKGKFKIPLAPGTYFLRVKGSMTSAETGPFVVRKGHVDSAYAHFDNGLR